MTKRELQMLVSIGMRHAAIHAVEGSDKQEAFHKVANWISAEMGDFAEGEYDPLYHSAVAGGKDLPDIKWNDFSMDVYGADRWPGLM